MSAHNHAEHVAGRFRCELSREEAMTTEPRRCDHDCQTHDYITHVTVAQGFPTLVRTDRVCDACGDTLQSFYDSDQEDA